MIKDVDKIIDDVVSEVIQEFRAATKTAFAMDDSDYISNPFGEKDEHYLFDDFNHEILNFIAEKTEIIGEGGEISNELTMNRGEGAHYQYLFGALKKRYRLKDHIFDTGVYVIEEPQSDTQNIGMRAMAGPFPTLEEAEAWLGGRVEDYQKQYSGAMAATYSSALKEEKGEFKELKKDMEGLANTLDTLNQRVKSGRNEKPADKMAKARDSYEEPPPQTPPSMLEDLIPGGLADRLSEEDFDKKALRKGIKVEMEHTDSREVAAEIAMDHLAEDPKYYDKLDKIHESFSIHLFEEESVGKGLKKFMSEYLDFYLQSSSSIKEKIKYDIASIQEMINFHKEKPAEFLDYLDSNINRDVNIFGRSESRKLFNSKKKLSEVVKREVNFDLIS